MDRPAQASLPELSAQFRTLTEVNLQDFLDSFGLGAMRRGRSLLNALGRFPAQRFARQMLAYDRQVGEHGLHLASSLTLRSYTRRLEILGAENLPGSGPLLVLSNHPGMADTLALFSSLPRPDLKVVAAVRPFLQALACVSRHLIFVSEEAGQRMGVVRSVVGHLRSGGAVLTFPAGEIEPDPAWKPGGIESLDRWSESVAIFCRMVPETTIITAIVSGVTWEAAMRHPLTRLRRLEKNQERLGASLQILVQTLLPFYRPVATRVAFGAPLLASQFSGSSSGRLMEAVTDQAQALIEKARRPIPER